jgi:serine/threonine-protein kinase RsbW
MGLEGPISRSIVVESVPSALGGVCERLLSELESKDFSQEDVFAVHLAVEEAFLNAVTHGNKMDARKEIRIDYLVDRDRIEICLTDEGNGFDPESIPDPRIAENLYRTHGRGLFLIRSYMDVVEYNGRGNRVRMVRYKEKPPLKQPWDQTQA